MTDLKILKFTRKTFEVLAIQVTLTEMEEIAKWCDGDVVRDAQNPNSSYIKVDVFKPLEENHGKAFPGNWILRSGGSDSTSYKVYTTRALYKTFDPNLIARWTQNKPNNSESQSNAA